MTATYHEKLEDVAIRPTTILLPNPEINMEKWAVIACDQFTSEKEYWERAFSFIGNAPSTLFMSLPECYLTEAGNEEQIALIHKAMNTYFDQGVFTTVEDSFILVERQMKSGALRLGLVAALDLEAYDYSPTSVSLVRATEGTILSRIPPRKKIRMGAPLELPHILVLIDDPSCSVIEPVYNTCSHDAPLYDFHLMAGGGHVRGWKVSAVDDMESIADALLALKTSLDPSNPLLYAIGDGNHSLATAKNCWEDIKKTLSDTEKLFHPSRWALVELGNIHDPALEFEPIHRVLFSCDKNDFLHALSSLCGSYELRPVVLPGEVRRSVQSYKGSGQVFGMISSTDSELCIVHDPQTSLSAATVQLTIDSLLSSGKAEVDYIHGEEATIKLGIQAGNIGLILPDIAKSSFFPSIRMDKVLPRKTFSMGHAEEKRYYIEARKIIP
ncbi:DUF1015 domain-containing protein [Parasphaerochaeta coccoides]|uniref:Uncharacterized conserved protein UCP033563 n=1 Tax=Parasphaerochaeta coccoides (strain ATCC BAA-1237 / DSM 17374 / SPN1) TaxID=760011 RepID=F4GK03_PARC1|nr:DUF1015 domain-containing protein [Parasphaerochaeta coccoides]AEC01775.1 Uncharacterized conserved protein UCP033563 [Parasphaerochaeta coccoides DSM 17374]